MPGGHAVGVGPDHLICTTLGETSFQQQGDWLHEPIEAKVTLKGAQVRSWEAGTGRLVVTHLSPITGTETTVRLCSRTESAHR